MRELNKFYFNLDTLKYILIIVCNFCDKIN